MFYLNQKSDVRVPGTPVVEFPYLRSSPQTHEMPTGIDPLVSANDAADHAEDDEGPRKWYQIRIHNPLWVIVIAMAFLFTVMALFVALG
jgi:hypothetical protein